MKKNIINQLNEFYDKIKDMSLNEILFYYVSPTLALIFGTILICCILKRIFGF